MYSLNFCLGFWNILVEGILSEVFNTCVEATVHLDFWNPLRKNFSKVKLLCRSLFLSILHCNPQPTQQCDNAPIAIVVGGNISDNSVGNNNNGGDNGSNGSGNGGGIDDDDGSNSVSSNKEVASTAMAKGTKNNQPKVAAEIWRSWQWQ